MHEPRRASDPAAERRPDRLMTEAHPEDRDYAGKPLHERNGDTGFAGRTWPRGNYDPVEHRGEFLDVVDGDRIVAAHEHLSPKLAQRLVEVEGERVVVVE